MPPPEHQARIRFESFDLDLQTRELRKNGRHIKLQDQPGKLLALLACHAGELVTRAEIEKALWREDEFVEFEHAVNTAVRKVREALGDDLERPRFIETLPRKGYRFIAAVETSAVTGPQSRAGNDAIQALQDPGNKVAVRSSSAGQVSEDNAAMAIAGSADKASGVAASHAASLTVEAPAAAETDFRLPRRMARLLFLTVQGGYLAMYCAALYRAEAVEEVLARVLGGRAAMVAPLLLVVAMCGITVRLYLISAVGLHHPAAGAKFLRLFPALFILDTLWAVSPLLLVRKIGYGLALGSIAPLAYLPFSQRTLVQCIYRRSNPANSNGSPESV
jgi:DNA-binding winged helix-turn-helix (wHTH) protein